MSRSIIHLNVADFAVAVERSADSRLKNRPVIIAQSATSRAAVYDMSDEAYTSGVRKGMLLHRAARRVPGATVLPPRRDHYERAMSTLLKRVLPYSPLIDMGEDDGHLFVDVTGTSRLFGPSVDVAWRLQKEIRTDLGLDPIWSVAANKLVAKVATRMVKPTGEYIVGSGDEASFLAPLPLDLIPGIEAKTLFRLRAFNLTRAHHLAALSLEQLEVPFGRQAPFLYKTVRGIDPSPVSAMDQKPPEAAADHTFDDDTNDRSVLESTLYLLTEQVAVTLRRKRLMTRRVRMAIHYSDGKRYTRQKVLSTATANDIDLFEIVRLLLHQTVTRRVRVRYLRLTCDRLSVPPVQMSLFDEERTERERRHGRMETLDRIRQRFGTDILRVGRTLAAHPLEN